LRLGQSLLGVWLFGHGYEGPEATSITRYRGPAVHRSKPPAVVAPAIHKWRNSRPIRSADLVCPSGML
jgi:hypothetical protein